MISKNYDGKPIRDLQRMLRTISYFTQSIPYVIPDGIFGESTKRSVAEFQTAYGLLRTGEADRETWDKIREVFERVCSVYSLPEKSTVFAKRNINVKQGDKRGEIFVLQAMMRAVGEVFINIPETEVTGVYDVKSVAAVKAIQELSGLEPTGVVDTATFNVVSGIYSSNVAKHIDFLKN